MTIKEAIKVLPFEASDDLVEKVLTDACLSGSAIYTTANKRAVDLCMAEICRYKLMEPDVSEEGLSIHQERERISQFRYDILQQYAETSSTREELW